MSHTDFPAERPRPLYPSSITQLGDGAREVLRQLATPRPLRSVLAYSLAYGMIIAAAWISERADNLAVYFLAVCLIAARQHSLYILNHDASHGSLFQSKKTNKWVATCLSNLPFLHHPEAWSYVQWRRVHLLHHSKLFTEGDPNHVGRARQGDTRTELRVAVLFWRCVRTGIMMLPQWLIGRQDYVAPRAAAVSESMHHLRVLFVPFRDDAEMELERRVKLAWFVAFAAVVTYLGAWKLVALYWLIPMYTVLPAVLHLMDLTEHRWTEDSQELNINSRSTVPGLLERVFISELPRTLHREHHVYMRVAVHGLPALSRLLVEHELTPPPGRGMMAVLRELAGRTSAATHEGPKPIA